MTAGGAFEFDCAECGFHIIDVSGLVRDPPLCMHCLYLPGWFNDPKLCAIFDPGNYRRVPAHETTEQ